MNYHLILFDRDGTLNYEEQSYHSDLSVLRPYPFSGPTLRALATAGHWLALATNQSGIARGYWSLDEVDRLHRRFFQEWGVEPRVYLCPHGPAEGCNCRKPLPGLVLRALADHQCPPAAALMVGDSLTDAGAAEQAGVDFALVLTGRGRSTRDHLSHPPAMLLDTVADLTGNLPPHETS